MRKCKISLAGIPEDVRESLQKTNTLFSAIEKLKIAIPEFANVMMIIVKKNRDNVSTYFFEDLNEFFIYYTKTMVFKRKPDDLIHCYSKDPGAINWSTHQPPTLIGLNLESRLRQ